MITKTVKITMQNETEILLNWHTEREKETEVEMLQNGKFAGYWTAEKAEAGINKAKAQGLLVVE